MTNIARITITILVGALILVTVTINRDTRLPERQEMSLTQAFRTEIRNPEGEKVMGVANVTMDPHEAFQNADISISWRDENDKLIWFVGLVEDFESPIEGVEVYKVSEEVIVVVITDTDNLTGEIFAPWEYTRPEK